MMDRNRLLLLAVLAAAVAAFFVFDLKQYLSLEFFHSIRASIDAYYSAHPIETAAVFSVIYVVVTALSLPGAAIMTLVGGAIFGVVTGTVVERAMDVLQVDPHGFDAMDRRLLQTIIEKFDGGPVGIESLGAAIGEERGTIEDVIEPYLIQQGFMMRTARGRVATRNAYLHFGLRPPQAAATEELPFDDD